MDLLPNDKLDRLLFIQLLLPHFSGKCPREMNITPWRLTEDAHLLISKMDESVMLSARLNQDRSADL